MTEEEDDILLLNQVEEISKCLHIIKDNIPNDTEVMISFSKVYKSLADFSLSMFKFGNKQNK